MEVGATLEICSHHIDRSFELWLVRYVFDFTGFLIINILLNAGETELITLVSVVTSVEFGYIFGVRALVRMHCLILIDQFKLEVGFQDEHCCSPLIILVIFFIFLWFYISLFIEKDAIAKGYLWLSLRWFPLLSLRGPLMRHGIW